MRWAQPCGVRFHNPNVTMQQRLTLYQRIRLNPGLVITRVYPVRRSTGKLTETTHNWTSHMDTPINNIRKYLHTYIDSIGVQHIVSLLIQTAPHVHRCVLDLHTRRFLWVETVAAMHAPYSSNAHIPSMVSSHDQHWQTWGSDRRQSNDKRARALWSHCI